MSESKLNWDGLREMETQWMSNALGASIANIGYPVGMGMAPDPESLNQAAGALFNRFKSLAAMVCAADAASSASEIKRLKELNAELLEALERLAFAAECRDNTMGDQIRLIEVRAELAAAADNARAAIAKATGGEA